LIEEPGAQSHLLFFVSLQEFVKSIVFFLALISSIRETIMPRTLEKEALRSFIDNINTKKNIIDLTNNLLESLLLLNDETFPG
jgi:hypothetical protein